MLPRLILFSHLGILAAFAAGVSGQYAKLPLSFENGQEPALFLSRGPGYTLYLTPAGATLESSQGAMRMALEGANPGATASGADPLPGTANYLVGSDPSRWRTNVPTFAKVRYRGIYPGVDLVYYGNQRQIEYDFVVAPGADPGAIRLRFDQAAALSLDSAGDLMIRAGRATVRLRKPSVYQEWNGVRTPVAGKFVLAAGNRASVQVGAYDRKRALVIDPVLSYATYLGGGDDEQAGTRPGGGIAVDGSGNVYLTGFTGSANFPASSGAPQPAGKGGRDAFVAKLNSSGTAVLYATYLGGAGSDTGQGIAVDAAGNAYVTGATTSADFPVSAGAAQRALGGASDAFVVKLNPSGSALVYSTYLGGTAGELNPAIAVDSSGNAYLAGYTTSANFPTTAGAFQTGRPGVAAAFVSKLNDSGGVLVYSTFLGGIGSDTNFGITVDAGQNAYVTGSTSSASFPTTSGAFQTTAGGGSDAFVAKMSFDGARLVYSTLLGGAGDDNAYRVAVDSAGSVTVTGATNSRDFPASRGAARTSTGNDTGVFVTRLNASGTALVYSVFLDGNSDEQGNDVSLDGQGNACVAGQTSSSNFPTTTSPLPTPGRTSFTAKFAAASGALLYATYVGGSGATGATAVAADASGNCYVAGWTESTDLATTSGAVQASSGGQRDVFVAKLGDLFSISGQVTDATGAGLSGVTIAVSGAKNLGAQTDAGGNFAFYDLAAGDYTLTPSRTNYGFTPPTQVFKGLSTSQNVQFRAAVLQFDIGGKVAEAGGKAVEGATVTLGGAKTATAQTDAAGAFVFRGLTAGANYTLSAAKTGYTMSPASLAFDNLSGNQAAANFTAAPSYSISGKVTGLGGAGLIDVTVTLAGGSAATAKTTAAGAYTFAGLTAGLNYTVSAAKASWAFTPASRAVSNLTSDQTADFTAALARVAADYIIADRKNKVLYRYSGSRRDVTTYATAVGDCPAGIASDTSGNVLVADPCTKAILQVTPAGVVSTLFLGDLMRSPFAVAQSVNGDLFVADNVANNIFRITKTKKISVFADLPVRSVPNIQNMGLVFAASGDLVVANDDGGGKGSIIRIAPDGTITPVLRGGGIESTGGIALDSAGNYLITDYRARALVRVSPTGSAGILASGEDSMCCNLSGVGFDPATNGAIVTLDTAAKLLSVSPTGTVSTLRNGPPLFEPTGLTVLGLTTTSPAIGGRVLEIDGSPAVKLTINLTGGPQALTAQTDAGGYYDFRNLVAGNNYTVAPARANSAFAPSKAVFENLVTNQTAGFQASVIYSISGRVADGEGSGIPDATVTASGGGSATAQTDANGVYTLRDLPAGQSYAVSAVKTGYIIAPTTLSFPNLSKNETGANFVAGLPASHGDYVVADRKGKAIFRVSPNGRTVSPLGAVGSCPVATASDGNGNIFVADPCTKAVYKVTPQGLTTAYFSGAPLSSPVAVAVDVAGSVFVGDNSANKVFRIPLGGASAVEFARMPVQSFPTPNNTLNMAISFAPNGDLVIANDDGNFKSGVAKVAPDGTVTNIYIGTAIETVGGVAADTAGNYVVADARQKAILRFGPNGVPVVLAGDLCCSLSGLLFDPNAGNFIAVLDTGSRIVSITPAGVVTTIKVGPPLNEPTGIAIVSTGTANPGIAGRVADAAGAALADVTMTLTGAQSLTSKTDAAGNYFFRNLQSGGNYTVTPSKTGLGFIPPNAAYTNLTRNQTANFTGGAVFKVSGRVQDATGSPAADVVLTLTGPETNLTAKTDSNGNYLFPSVFGGASYVLTPSKAGALFTPASREITKLSQDAILGFLAGSAAAVGDYIIADKVGKALFRVSPATRLPSSLTSVGGCPTGLATDAAGNIYVADACTRSIYRVTAAGVVATAFTGNPLQAPIAVAVDVAGNLVVADNGTNQIVRIAPDGKTVTVLAERLPVSSPTGAAQNIAMAYDNNGDLVVVNDDGAGKSSIARIRPSGELVSVLVSTGVESAGALVIEPSGNYLIGDYRQKAIVRSTPAGILSVVVGGLGSRIAGMALDPASGNVIASLDLDSKVISITPAGAVTTLVSQSQVLSPSGVVVLGATGAAPAITGRVTDPTGAAGLADILITLSGPSTSTTRTDANGGYAFRNLTAGATYTVTPSRAGFLFTPTNAIFENLRAPQVANFRGGAVFDITVRVVDASGGPVAGVTIQVDGVPQPVVTDIVGSAVFRGLAAGGAYSISAGKEGLIFVPRQQVVASLTANVTVTFVAGVPPSPGDFLVADRKAKAIIRISPNGRSINPIASLGECPSGVTVDGAGQIYAVDPCTKQIFRVTTTGVALPLFTGDPLVHPTAIAVDRAGALYIADNATSSIFKFVPNSATLPTEFAKFRLKSTPTAQNMGLLFEPGGTLLAVSDDSNGRSEILRIAADGGVTVVVPALPGLESAAGIAVDGDGNFIVADYAARSFARVTPSGGISVLAGAEGRPAGLIYDPVGNRIVGALDVESRIVSITGGTLSQLVQGPPLNEPVGLAIYGAP